MAAGLVGAGAARAAVGARAGRLPVGDSERIVNAKESVSGGVLNIELEREDIGDVRGPLGVMLRNGLGLLAFHQHLPDLDPPVWFMHFRGVGAPLDLARAAHATVRTTSTPLPQAPPAHPTTPLDPERRNDPPR